MSYCLATLDISARALSDLYTWRVPERFEKKVHVGSVIAVEFNHRICGGYVIQTSDTPLRDLDEAKIKDVLEVLADSAFNEDDAKCAQWIAKEYAAPLIDAIKLFLPPGHKIRLADKTTGESVHLICECASAKTCRRARLTEAAAEYTPRTSAVMQQKILKELALGERDVSELSFLYPGCESALTTLKKRGVVEIYDRRLLRVPDTTTLSSARAFDAPLLTKEQKKAVAFVCEACLHGAGDVILIDGVTGSGKTEVYLFSISEVLANGKSAIVLVPEIALTPQTLGRFRSRFGDTVAVIHSRLSMGERFDQWDRISSGAARVVVGTRSALFAPIRNLGLIIIDEEHDGSYKQDASPRYHAREVAAHMAASKGCALVLGSATPSLESLMRCRNREFRGSVWTRLELRDRPAAAAPREIEVVDMCREFSGGNRSIFSRALTDALLRMRDKKQKAVLLLNRRGFASFLMCRECGCVPECPTCSTSLTYHEREKKLLCHSCAKAWPARAYPDVFARCPVCGSRYMAAFGVGTQRVEDELVSLLGEGVDIIRMDFDTTREKNAHTRLLERFDAAECAVLLGTQMIAKGLDFPEVTLVGVINADTILKLPDLRAAERTYALLEQVAGRSGRGVVPGKVIIQSYWAHHPAIEAVAMSDREIFLVPELAERKEAGYPPFARVSRVLLWSQDKAQAVHVSGELRELIQRQMEEKRVSDLSWELLGPADCLKSKINNQYRRHLILKSPLDSDPASLLQTAVIALGAHPKVKIAIDIDTQSFM